MRTTRIGLTLLTLCCAAAFAAADNWPRFRGPNGAGTSADKDIPVEWTPANFLWKTSIPGKGHSSPITWDDNVFVQSASDNGADRILVCVGLEDGKVRWTKTVSAARGRINKLNSQASSTPATDGERVYVVYWAADKLSMSAYDFKGNEVWSKDVGRAYNAEHGAAHSPMVFGGKVFVNNDQTGGSEVVAFDAKTGKQVWKVERRAVRTCYSVPFVRENPNGSPELIIASTTGITAYNPDDGKVIWDYKWTFKGKELRTVGSPIYSDGVVFATSGDGDGSRGMIAVKADGKGVVWQNSSALIPYVPCMLAHGEHLYGIHDHQAMTAVCIDARTGKLTWSDRLSTKSRAFASPVLVDGKVYAPAEIGEVYVFEAKPEFKLLAKNPLGEPLMATPAVSQGRMLIRGEKTLFCIGKAK